MRWDKKLLNVVVLLISAIVLSTMFPMRFLIQGIGILDIGMMFLIAAIAVTFGLYRYFYWNSPHIFTETDKVCSNNNEFKLVVPDDPRIPPHIMIPYNGYNVQRVFMSKEDMGRGGGVLFSPHYQVEAFGQHLRIHGKPLGLSIEAVESNQWMYSALQDEPEYEHGKTHVYLTLWGEGPPVDLEPDEQAAFRRTDVQGSQQALDDEVETIADKTMTEISKRFRTIEEARTKEDAQKVMEKETEVKRRKEREGDEER